MRDKDSRDLVLTKTSAEQLLAKKRGKGRGLEPPPFFAFLLHFSFKVRRTVSQ